MDMRKITCATLLGAAYSSFAFAQCEPERRAYDVAGQSCHKRWSAKNDIAECRNEELAAAAAKLQQCYRDINAGKRQR